MSARILSNSFSSLAADVRLGARLVMRRWKRLDRATRSRIELGAVFSLLPLSAAIAAVAAAPSALDLDALQSQPIVRGDRDAVDRGTGRDRSAAATSHSSARCASSVVNRSTPCSRAWASTTRPRRGSCGPKRRRARWCVWRRWRRLVQANIDGDGRLNWLRAYSGSMTVPHRQASVSSRWTGTRPAATFRVTEVAGRARTSCRAAQRRSSGFILRSRRRRRDSGFGRSADRRRARE